MIVTGGRDKNIQETLITDVYDTETSEWRKFSAIGLFRHSCFIKDTSLYIYGGFENRSPNTPIQNLYKIDVTSLFATSQTLINKINNMYSNNRDNNSRSTNNNSHNNHQNVTTNTNVNNNLNKSPSVSNTNNYPNNNVNNSTNNNNLVNNNNQQMNSNNTNINNSRFMGGNNNTVTSNVRDNNLNNVNNVDMKYMNYNNNNQQLTNYSNNNIQQQYNYSVLNQLLNKDSLSNPGIMDNNNKNTVFLLSNQAVVIQASEDLDDSHSIMRKIDIDKLNQESKRIGHEYYKYKVQQKRYYNEEVINKFIEVLLHPFDWHNQIEMDSIHNNLPFNKEEIDILLKEVAQIIHKEKTLINVRSPTKVFGNLFGQYYDLMRFFEAYGNPSDVNPMGDINISTYVFLGDYCDRGTYSLETIFLLFALKVRYPDSIILLRGHHEDENVNKKLGLFEDCDKRMNDPQLYAKINAIFDILPLACTIDNKILCVHGGIGSRLNSLSEISKIQRPFSVVQDVKSAEQQIIIDLLYSEYSDEITEVSINEERDLLKLGFITKYGRDRVGRFLNDNGLSLLLCSHSWVTEGVKAYNNDRVVIVYSASNYMDKAGNIAGILNISKNCNQVIPKLLDTFKQEKKFYKNNKNQVISPVRFKK